MPELRSVFRVLGIYNFELNLSMCSYDNGESPTFAELQEKVLEFMFLFLEEEGKNVHFRVRIFLEIQGDFSMTICLLRNLNILTSSCFFNLIIRTYKPRKKLKLSAI